MSNIATATEAYQQAVAAYQAAVAAHAQAVAGLAQAKANREAVLAAASSPTDKAVVQAREAVDSARDGAEMAQAKAKAAQTARDQAAANLAVATSVQLKADYDAARAEAVAKGALLLAAHADLAGLVDEVNASHEVLNEALQAAQAFTVPVEVIALIEPGALPTRALLGAQRVGYMPRLDWTREGFGQQRRMVSIQGSVLAD